MKYDNVSVLSVAHVDAPHRVTSEEIEAQLAPTMERLGVPLDLLRQRSGIIERRVWDEGVVPSAAAAQAGEKAIEAAGVDRSKLGILINTRCAATIWNRRRRVSRTPSSTSPRPA
jgi:3-oxoacyl-[acyl-carrier-protein] synthase-3